MKFARIVFTIAGIYGLIVLLPDYFFESRMSSAFPPAITHLEFFYGFLGVGIAWQIAFLILGRDPVRYRAFIIPAILEKATYAVAGIALFLQHRLDPTLFTFAMVDLLLGLFFIAAYVKTPRSV